MKIVDREHPTARNPKSTSKKYFSTPQHRNTTRKKKIEEEGPYLRYERFIRWLVSGISQDRVVFV